MSGLLERRRPDDVRARRIAIDARTREQALAIVEDVRARGDVALREHAERLGDRAPGEPLVLGTDELARALETIDDEARGVLERTAERIRGFALAQREALSPLAVDVPGGRAGHTLAPVASAGCYAPAGRFPLPSSVLMTAVTARVAGVERVVVASPRPGPVQLAAAAVAGADAVLAVGGAQAIAALAYGTASVDAVDFLCGPGNRWVTAAKQLVFGDVGVDMLAGPSELVVLADASADPRLVAADLLAQAEHDPDALPILVALDEGLQGAVDAELARQVAELDVPVERLGHGFSVLVRDVEQAVALCDALAPEHLEVMTVEAAALAGRLRNFGAAFLGAAAGEALGDYGAGPNHVLPTGGGARHRGGLSVLDFLRVRTWLELDGIGQADGFAKDAVGLARLEGLEAHARSVEARS